MSKGVVIVAVSQCLRGRVDLHAYALGRALEDIGVIGAGDATTESVVTKLAFLLSWSDTRVEQVRHYMALSLHGELTEGANTTGGVGFGGHAGDWATTSRMVDSGDVYFSGLGRRIDTSNTGVSVNVGASASASAAAASLSPKITTTTTTTTTTNKPSSPTPTPPPRRIVTVTPPIVPTPPPTRPPPRTQAVATVEGATSTGL